MVGEVVVTVVGNIGGEPELRFTPSGAAVCNFSVAATPRRKAANGDWEDGEPTWYKCAAWREMAENCAESLQRGMQVIVVGRLTNRKYETREGNSGWSLEIDVENVGPALRFATAAVTRSRRSGGGGGGGGGQQQGGGQRGGGQQQGGQQGGGAPANDPWATPPQGQDPWAVGGQSEEPPF